MSGSTRPRRRRRSIPRGLTVAGLVLTLVGGLAPRAGAATTGADAVTIAGGPGRSAANQFIYPTSVAVDARGDLFVTDTGDNRVQEWTPGATQRRTVLGGVRPGSGAGQLFAPYGVAIDGHGDVLIADTGNRRVQQVTLAPSTNPADPTTTTLGYYTLSSSTTVNLFDTIALVATVDSGNGTGPPGGNVVFLDNSVNPSERSFLAQIGVCSNGATSYAAVFASAGDESNRPTFSAWYSGDDSFAPSQGQIQVFVHFPR